MVFQSHPRLKIFVSSERAYVTSYLWLIATSSLYFTISEIQRLTNWKGTFSNLIFVEPKFENVFLALHRWSFACEELWHHSNWPCNKFSGKTYRLTTIHALQTTDGDNRWWQTDNTSCQRLNLKVGQKTLRTVEKYKLENFAATATWLKYFVALASKNCGSAWLEHFPTQLLRLWLWLPGLV